MLDTMKVTDGYTKKHYDLRYHEMGPWLNTVRKMTLSPNLTRGGDPKSLTIGELTERIAEQVEALYEENGDDEYEDAPSYGTISRVLRGANWYGGYMMRVLQIARGLDVQIVMSKRSRTARIK